LAIGAVGRRVRLAARDDATVEGERERQQSVRGRPAVDGDSAGRDAPGADDCHLRRHDDEVLRANDGSQRFMKWPAPLLCRARLAELPGHRRN